MSGMIANNLSVVMAKKLVKISTVAAATGISRTTLTNLYYRRTEFISLSVMDRLCKYLECTIGDILEYVGDNEEEESS